MGDDDVGGELVQRVVFENDAVRPDRKELLRIFCRILRAVETAHDIGVPCIVSASKPRRIEFFQITEQFIRRVRGAHGVLDAHDDAVFFRVGKQIFEGSPNEIAQLRQRVIWRHGARVERHRLHAKLRGEGDAAGLLLQHGGAAFGVPSIQIPTNSEWRMASGEGDARTFAASFQNVEKGRILNIFDAPWIGDDEMLRPMAGDFVHEIFQGCFIEDAIREKVGNRDHGLLLIILQVIDRHRNSGGRKYEAKRN